MNKTERINTRITSIMAEQLDLLSGSKGMTRSEYLRYLLHEKIEQNDIKMEKKYRNNKQNNQKNS